jgi:hypothetical protein
MKATMGILTTTGAMEATMGTLTTMDKVTAIDIMGMGLATTIMDQTLGTITTMEMDLGTEKWLYLMILVKIAIKRDIGEGNVHKH